MADATTLQHRLSQAIPAGICLEYYHTSTPPTQCAALYMPSQGAKPEKTYCESQSLLVTAPSQNAEHHNVAIFAIEVEIYTTLHLTTIFVSKADSTGFATLLKLPSTSGSLLQSLTTAFVSWIVPSRQVSDKRLVLSLFARAQDQYLFPGSVENKSKHVLNDRQLVKWWCKSLDPVLREYEGEVGADSIDSHERRSTSKAYLVVPGHDKYETRAFFPPSARSDIPNAPRWVADHPLWQIAPDPAAAPRCLVPHFPDDPKSRFLDELDEEISDVPSSQQAKYESPSKRGRGQWRSVRTLGQFWDAMAFRQECASGRLVGFLWMLFTPPDYESRIEGHPDEKYVPISVRKRDAKAELDIAQDKKRQKMTPVRKPLTGPIRPRAPRVKTSTSASDPHAKLFPEKTCYFYIPRSTRGSLVLPTKSFTRIHDILLRLDFTGLETAAESTQKWIEETAVIAGRRGYEWSVKITGSKVSAQSATNGTAIAANVLQPRRRTSVDHTTVNLLAVKKKPKTEERSNLDSATNMLGSGLVRKKPKVEEAVPSTTRPDTSVKSSAPDPDAINVLGSGLVRKKVK